MPSKTVKSEVVLTDILERLRSIEKNTSISDKSLDDRLCKIEKEIENVKKAAHAFSLFVKIMGSIIAFIVMMWNFLGKFFVRKI